MKKFHVTFSRGNEKHFNAFGRTKKTGGSVQKKRPGICKLKKPLAAFSQRGALMTNFLTTHS